MPRKKIHELSEEVSLPKALVVGSGEIVSLLVEKLKEYGCQVKKMDFPPPDLFSLGKFNYIFQFGNFPLVEKFLELCLSSSGKYLFIEGEETEDFARHGEIKIIRIGDGNLWQKEELAKKILRTMFMGKEGSIADVRKSYRNGKKIKEPVSAIEPGQQKTPTNNRKIPLSDNNKRNPESYLEVRKHPLLGRLGVLSLVIILFLLFSGVSGVVFRHYYSLKDTFSRLQSHLTSSSLEAAAEDIKDAKSKLSFFKSIYRFSNEWIIPLRASGYFKQAGAVLYSADRLLDTSGDLLDYSGQVSQKSFGLMGDGGNITKHELDDITQKISSLKNELIFAKTELEQVNLPFFPRENLNNYFLLSIEKLKAAQELIPLAEAVFLSDKQKTYLILLQNNMELRPTGGFIGSFALLTIDKGKITDFKIEDVYTADGQLKGHVDPPSPIRKYLSQPHFFLRDSNWDPDFAVSAELAGWFLMKELGITTDGVIGINLYAAQKILQVLGPVTLADFNNEIITADNFFIKAQQYTQKDFFPGSTQKKNFLSSVAKEIFSSITFEKNITWFRLLPEVKKALEEKNILIYSHDPQVNRIIENLGFSGRMTEVKCLSNNANFQETSVMPDTNCIPDYLAMVEANLGVNKANYFIGKSTTVQKKIDETGQMTSLITVSYENQSTPEINPEATYVNYLRLFVPVDSILTSIFINNIPVPASEIDMEKYETDKASYGFLVKIAPGEKVVFRAVFTHSKIFSEGTSSYQFFYQKQAGDKISPLVLSVAHPDNLYLEPVNFQSASARENEIYYTTDTSVDRVFAISTGR